LVRKGFEESDLPVTEQPGFGASDDNHTNRFTPTEQWDGQYSAEAKASRNVVALGLLLQLRLQTGDMNRSLVEDRTS
jgi:hypothetical protein